MKMNSLQNKGLRNFRVKATEYWAPYFDNKEDYTLKSFFPSEMGGFEFVRL